MKPGLKTQSIMFFQNSWKGIHDVEKSFRFKWLLFGQIKNI